MDKKIWLTEPVAHDFPAAQDYLELLFDETVSKGIVKRLKKAPTVIKKAKDILRASRLPLLAKDSIHVAEDMAKVKKGQKLSPILLVRSEKLIIADGYHRACAIFYLAEDMDIPCRIVDKVKG